MKLEEIPTIVLCHDTGAENREKAIRILERVFKKELTTESELTILFVRVKS